MNRSSYQTAGNSLFSSEITLTTAIFYVTGPSELENACSSFINNDEVRKAFRQSIVQSFTQQFDNG